MATPVSTSSVVDINIDDGEDDEAYSLQNCSIMLALVVLLVVEVCVLSWRMRQIKVRIFFFMH
jgi:hypothetical protein